MSAILEIHIRSFAAIRTDRYLSLRPAFARPHSAGNEHLRRRLRSGAEPGLLSATGLYRAGSGYARGERGAALPADNFRIEPLEKLSFEEGSAGVVRSSAAPHFARDEDHFHAMLRGPWRGGAFLCRAARITIWWMRLFSLAGRKSRADNWPIRSKRRWYRTSVLRRSGWCGRRGLSADDVAPWAGRRYRTEVRVTGLRTRRSASSANIPESPSEPGSGTDPSCVPSTSKAPRGAVGLSNQEPGVGLPPLCKL